MRAPNSHPLPWRVQYDEGRCMNVIVNANGDVIFAAHMFEHEATLDFIVEAANATQEGVQ